jgi:Mg-chelatase subunit ChlD
MRTGWKPLIVVAVLHVALPPLWAAAQYRARTDVVVIDVAVTDRGKHVAGLTKDAFELRDNGVLQHIQEVRLETMPIDVTMTIDVSGSMTPAKRIVVARAIGTISGALRPEDRGAVVTFSSHISELAALQHPPIRTDFTVGGDSSVVDALLLSLATAPNADRRQLGLFMSDGDDSTSHFDPATVVDTARHANGPTSILIVRNGGNPARRMQDMFRQVADTTGGEVLRLGPGDDLSQGFLSALENFRSSYVLRYSPTGRPTAGWHDVAVTVRPKNYSVRARRGYVVHE